MGREVEPTGRPGGPSTFMAAGKAGTMWAAMRWVTGNLSMIPPQDALFVMARPGRA
jgi:hypothetical protein